MPILKQAKSFLGELKSEVGRDQIGDVAAMLSYYALFSIFPMAIFIVTITLIVLPSSVLIDATEMFTKTMPPQVGTLLQEQILRMEQAAAGGLALGSALAALWGAKNGSAALGRALNRIYGKEEARPWWKIQLTSLLVTLSVATLVLLALGLLVVGPIAGHLVADRLGLGGVFDTMWTIGRWLIAAVLVMFVWAILYKFLPNVHVPLRVFTPGAITGVLLWVGISQLFALYLRNFGNYDKTYGALAAVVIFIFWLNLTNLALLVGAEINDVIDNRKERANVDEKKLTEGATPAGTTDGRAAVPGTALGRPVTARTAVTRGGVPAELGDLARRLGSDLTTLARDHVELAKLELGKSLKATAIDGGAALLGGIVSLIGLAMLCATAVAALGGVIPQLWLRMLICSVAYLLLGGAVVAGFVKRLKGDLPPDLSRTKAEARMTMRSLRNEVQHG